MKDLFLWWEKTAGAVCRRWRDMLGACVWEVSFQWTGVGCFLCTVQSSLAEFGANLWGELKLGLRTHGVQQPCISSGRVKLGYCFWSRKAGGRKGRKTPGAEYRCLQVGATVSAERSWDKAPTRVTWARDSLRREPWEGRLKWTRRAHAAVRGSKNCATHAAGAGVLLKALAVLPSPCAHWAATQPPDKDG